MWFLYVGDILFTLDVVLQLWRSLYYIGIEKKEETNRDMYHIQFMFY